MTSPVKPLGQCCSNPWTGEWKIAKMGMVHWSKWLPCPYMVITFKHFPSPEPNKPWALIFAQIMGTGALPKLLKWWFCVDVWRLTFLPPKWNLLPHAFVWAIFFYIASIEVTCRSAVAKIVLRLEIYDGRHLVCVCYISLPLCCLHV